MFIVDFTTQGGPGASSTGFGNFVEIGPLDVNLAPRNTTWVSHWPLKPSWGHFC